MEPLELAGRFVTFSRAQFHSLFSGDPMGVPSLNPCTLKNASYYVW